jgi:hypothetical protein
LRLAVETNDCTRLCNDRTDEILITCCALEDFAIEVE